MAGAIVPNDWDGVSYACYQITWPNSEKYGALLLGQVTQPTYPDFWDSNSGDVGEATDGIQTAFNTTYLNLASLSDCEQPMEPIPYFRAKLSSNQVIPADIWTLVEFNTLLDNLNTPMFDTTKYWHNPQGPGLEGLWHYSGELAYVGQAAIYIAIAVNGVIRKYLYQPSGAVLLTGNVPITNDTTTISIYAYSSGVSGTIANDLGYAFFEGFRVGPVT